MKRFTVTLALLVVMAVATSRFAYAGDQDFTLVNNTGANLHAIYISPSHEDHWGSDVLGGQVVENGGTCHFTFHEDTAAAHWDIKVEDTSGNSLYWRELDLTSISQIELDGDGVAHCK